MVNSLTGSRLALEFHRDQYLDLCCSIFLINDFPGKLKSICKMFANESKVYRCIQDETDGNII